MKLSQIIKQYRENADITMQDFAEKCGLSKGYISMLEKGQHPQNNRPLVPSISTLQKLAVGMNMSIDQLFSIIDSDVVVSVNVPTPAQDLKPDEERLLADYRDASEEIRGAAASMLHDSAESQRKEKSASTSNVG